MLQQATEHDGKISIRDVLCHLELTAVTPKVALMFCARKFLHLRIFNSPPGLLHLRLEGKCNQWVWIMLIIQRRWVDCGDSVANNTVSCYACKLINMPFWTRDLYQYPHYTVAYGLYYWPLNLQVLTFSKNFTMTTFSLAWWLLPKTCPFPLKSVCLHIAQKNGPILFNSIHSTCFAVNTGLNNLCI